MLDKWGKIISQEMEKDIKRKVSKDISKEEKVKEIPKKNVATEAMLSEKLITDKINDTDNNIFKDVKSSNSIPVVETVAASEMIKEKIEETKIPINEMPNDVLHSLRIDINKNEENKFAPSPKALECRTPSWRPWIPGYISKFSSHIAKEDLKLLEEVEDMYKNKTKWHLDRSGTASLYYTSKI